MSVWQLTAKYGKRKGKSWPISDEPLVVGRNESCDITLRDSLVSREHCQVQYVKDELILEDLGSSNCTLLNGRSVTRSALSVGDELIVGEATFMVTRSSVEDQSTGIPIPLHTTQHLKLGSSVLGGNLDTEIGTPNVSELALLNALANELADCHNSDEIFRAVVECVSEHCAPPELFLANTKTRADVLTFPAGSVLDSDVAERLQRFASEAPETSEFESRRTRDGTAVFTSFIPLRIGGSFVGAFGGSQVIRENSDPIPDLLFAKSIARLVAPFLVSISGGIDESYSTAQLSEKSLAFLGESKAARQARRLIAIAATADLPVLIQGETGTGKELAARLIHELSNRSEGPLAVANCAAISEALFESELFGHVKGAFTDAISDREGLLSEAHEGHLFLDEIADLSTRNQARILRAIETGEFRPVGADKDRASQFTVIAATNRDLPSSVKADQFREDLYYRLAGIEIYLPPLSERRSDIPILLNHFSEEFANAHNIGATTFDKTALDYLTARPWPGNVRELRNTVGKISSFLPSQQVSRTLVENVLANPRPSDHKSTRRIGDVERLHIEQIMTECGGRIKDAAEVLGMHRNTLSKKLKKYDIAN